MTNRQEEPAVTRYIVKTDPPSAKYETAIKARAEKEKERREQRGMKAKVVVVPEGER